jgi:hypothetical protein
MTGDQSRLLKPFDRVCWQNNQADQGTVIEKNWSGVTIKWDSRGKQAILHNDMARVERVTATKARGQRSTRKIIPSGR